MARKPVAVNSKNIARKTHAVISIWEHGMGFGKGMKPIGQTFERVNWFTNSKAARKFFANAPQGQDKKDGEIQRVLVRIVERLK